MNEAAQIWADLQLQFWGAATVFYRIGAAVSMLPGFGESSLSVRLKLLLGIALTIVITPTLGTTARVEPSIWFIFSETAIGLMFGIGVRLFVYTLQTAGAIAANTTSLAQLFSQGQETQLPIISHTLHWAGLALIFHAGVHLTFIGYLIAGMRVGDLVMEKRWGVVEFERPIQASILGLTILLLLGWVPIVGEIVTPLAALLGTGALVLGIWRVIFHKEPWRQEVAV